MRTQPTSIFRVSDRMSNHNRINQHADAGDVNQLEIIGAISFGGWIKINGISNRATLSQKSIVSKGDTVSIALGNNTITINGIPNFSQLVMTSTTTNWSLQLLGFTANMIGNNAQLQWQTTNEINVMYFELERHLPNDNGCTSIANIVARNGFANTY